MKKEKLLVTASTFPRWKDDTEPRFVLDISKALNKYFDVTVLVPACPGAKDKEILEGVKVIRYHYFPIHKFETLCYPGAIVPRIKEKKSRIILVPFLFLGLWINLLWRVKKYDYIHAHWFIPQGIIQSFFRKKYIVTGHGSDVCSMNHGIMLKLKRRTLKNAAAVTVVSTHLENVVKEICPSVKPEIISMGCWTNNFNKDKKIDNYFNQNGKKVLLFVGRLEERKGVQYLIEAMKDIDAILVIVGRGTYETELRHQAKKYGNKVQFLGGKTHTELKTIYASSDIFVAPSITMKTGEQEGFGLVILEAMASGLPVVATNNGGIPDIIKDGINGFLVEEKNSDSIAEKVNRMFNNQELFDSICEQSLETVKQYDYNAIGKKYAQLIRECKR